MSFEAIIIAVVPSVLAVISAFVTVKLSTRSQHKEREATASESNVDTAIKLKSWMEEELEEVRARCTATENELASQRLEVLKLRRRVTVLSSYANALILQIIEIGIQPVVTLDEIERALKNGKKQDR